MSRVQMPLAGGVLAFALASCGPPTETRPVLERRAGVLAMNGGTPAVTVPTDGAVGAPISITVITLGGGCVRQGDTEAQVAGLEANVTPYDSVYVYLPPSMACTMELREYAHRTTVTFAQPGEARVRVHGRLQPADPAITVERTVRIR